MVNKLRYFFYKLKNRKKIKLIFLIDLCFLTDKLLPVEINGDRLDEAIGCVYSHDADHPLDANTYFVVNRVVEEACSQLHVEYKNILFKDIHYLAEQIGSILINGTVAKESTK